MRDRNRVLVICTRSPDPPFSGGQLRTLRLLETIERAGGTPHLIVADPDEEEEAEVLRGRGWEVDLISSPSRGALGRVLNHAAGRVGPRRASVKKRIAELAPNASFVQFEGIANAALASKTPESRIVVSAHNVESEVDSSLAREHGSPVRRLHHGVRARTMRAAEAEAASAADAVLCVSEHDAAYYWALGAERTVLAPNGVDEELLRIPPPPADGEVVLFFGLLSWPPNSDGLERFIRQGWSELIGRRPHALLRVVGARASSKLERLIGECERVELVGAVPAIEPELERANLVLVPIWAGGGTRLKAIESMAAGRPLVGTPLGLERIGFAPGRHGVLAETPSALARAAADLLGDRDSAMRMGAAGRQAARLSRWRNVLCPAEELYAELLRETRP